MYTLYTQGINNHSQLTQASHYHRNSNKTLHQVLLILFREGRIIVTHHYLTTTADSRLHKRVMHHDLFTCFAVMGKVCNGFQNYPYHHLNAFFLFYNHTYILHTPVIPRKSPLLVELFFKSCYPLFQNTLSLIQLYLFKNASLVYSLAPNASLYKQPAADLSLRCIFIFLLKYCVNSTLCKVPRFLCSTVF